MNPAGFAARFPGLDADLAASLDSAPPAADGNESVAGARERVTRATASVPAGPPLAEVADVRLGHDVPARAYRTVEDVGAAEAIVYFHGGGWVTGDLDYGDALCRQIARASRALVLNVGYRLAPEARYPAAVEDAASVVRDIRRRCPAGDGRLVLAGDSAGANLVAAVCASSVAEPGLRPNAQVLVYPVLDDDFARKSYGRNDGIVLSRAKMGWFMDHYCPDPARRREPSFAPLKASSFRGLPRTAVIVAGHDPLRDEGVDYGARLAAAGVPVEVTEHPGMVHGFLRQTARSPAARRATEHVVDSVVAALRGTPFPAKDSSR